MNGDILLRGGEFAEPFYRHPELKIHEWRHSPDGVVKLFCHVLVEPSSRG